MARGSSPGRQWHAVRDSHESCRASAAIACVARVLAETRGVGSSGKRHMSVKFSHGKKRFEIKREGGRGSAIFVGYVDGIRSVTGPRAHVAARVLIQKHVVGAPEAVL